MMLDLSSLPPVLPILVVLRTREPQFIPAFLGSALHGALGRVLWKMVCAFPRRRECAGCPLVHRCAYPALFANRAPDDQILAALGVRHQAPRPMVLAPQPGWTHPSGHPQPIAAGVEIPFRLTLIGNAIGDLPLVIVALKKLAENGIGKPLDVAEKSTTKPSYAASEMLRVVAHDSQVIYDSGTIHDCRPQPPAALCPLQKNPDLVNIHLVTPLRLKREGKVRGHPSAADFALTLARRANSLALLDGAAEKAVDEGRVERLAASIRVEESQTRLVHVRRYSARQGRGMDWPGVMGRFRWRGPAVAELWPLLRFGELVQIGKGTALGFGRYQIDGKV